MNPNYAYNPNDPRNKMTHIANSVRADLQRNGLLAPPDKDWNSPEGSYYLKASHPDAREGKAGRRARRSVQTVVSCLGA